MHNRLRFKDAYVFRQPVYRFHDLLTDTDEQVFRVVLGLDRNGHAEG